jgi:hypothetical protein
MFAMMFAGYCDAVVAMMLKENVNPTTAAKCPKLPNETAHVCVLIHEDVSKITPAIKLMLMKPRDARTIGMYEEKMRITYEVNGIGQWFEDDRDRPSYLPGHIARAEKRRQLRKEAEAQKEARSRQNMRKSHDALWQHRQQPPASEWAELW